MNDTSENIINEWIFKYQDENCIYGVTDNPINNGTGDYFTTYCKDSKTALEEQLKQWEHLTKWEKKKRDIKARILVIFEDDDNHLYTTGDSWFLE